ncbi:MAG TPA: hypothetical protein VK505_08135, partial [Steroidobacteraceae bacterium]|nr:hypothetical protein [Steroidobacteraceae bacterium]
MNLAWLSDFLRLSARVYAAIAVVAGAILAAPDRLLSILGLDELLKYYRGLVGLALVAALGLLL